PEPGPGDRGAHHGGARDRPALGRRRHRRRPDHRGRRGSAVRLLALDTATSAITAAVHDGDRVLASRTVPDARRTTELLAPLLRDVLTEAGTRPEEVTRVAAGTGPGPFTGLRAGLVTARTMAHVSGTTVLGVCSLDALAEAARRAGARGELLVASDARRRAVTRPADLPEVVRALPTVGRGPLLYPELLTVAPGPEVLDVDAAVLADLAVARLAAGEDMPAEPLYLRRPDTAAPAPPKSVIAP